MSKKELGVAIVTGASSGIGEATAELLANSGYKVYGTSRKGAQAAQRSYKMIALDVNSEESIEAALKEVFQIEGRIDLLVNNAGFGVAPGGAEESSIEQTKMIFDTNFFGIVRMTRAVVPYMRKQGEGRIINIGSILGLIPAPYMATYAATKHAVEGFSESLDHELRTRGIRVSVVEPGYTNTQFEANTLEVDAKIDEYNIARKALAKLIKIAVAGGDDPKVVANVVLKAANAKHPKPRYAAGKLACRLSFLRRFAPAALVDMGIRKELKLDSLAKIASQL
ncbi:MAG TPA: oxidoreductase [Methylotenera sp.]|nr:oxidoreductase [Methylotenera sp.]